MPTVDFLRRFAAAWNAHDVDAILAHMADDGVFISSDGTRHAGAASLRAAFADIVESVADLRFTEDRHFVSGDRGLSEWRLTGTDEDGTRLDAAGCDVFTFRDGRIAVKDTYLK